MPEQAKSASPAPERFREEREALLEEIARQKEEILRLRDLLIAKDAELGQAKAGLAELAEYSARFAVTARRMKGRLPARMQVLLARLRRLLSR